MTNAEDLESSLPYVYKFNLCDLNNKREVSYNKAMEKAVSFDSYYIETSAKTDINIEKLSIIK